MKIGILAGALALSSSFAFADTNAKLTNDDLKLVEHIHHVNQMEIELAKLAQTNGTSAVKTYAQMMVTDHTKADKDVAAFAKKHGTATIPKETAATDADKAKDKAMSDQVTVLKKAKGSDFDRQYLMMMVDGHDTVLAELKGAMDTIGDPELKTMVQGELVPAVQTHADKARALQTAIPKS